MKIVDENKYLSYDEMTYDSKEMCLMADEEHYQRLIVQGYLEFPMCTATIHMMHFDSESDMECVMDVLNRNLVYKRTVYGNEELDFPCDVYTMIDDYYIEFCSKEDIDAELQHVSGILIPEQPEEPDELTDSFAGIRIGDEIENENGDTYRVIAINGKRDRTLLLSTERTEYIGAWGLQRCRADNTKWYWSQGHYFRSNLYAATKYVVGVS